MIDLATQVDSSRVSTLSNANTFNFTRGKGIVKMTPLNKALPLKVVREFKRTVAPYITLRACYKNAVLAALYFKSKGYNVQVIEGYYEIDHSRFKRDRPFYHHRFGWDTHRWIIINGKHIDITLDCGVDICKTCHCNYKSVRVYEPETLLAFALKTGRDYDFVDQPKWCSSLDGITYDFLNQQHKWSLIDSSGCYVCLKTNVETAA